MEKGNQILTSNLTFATMNRFRGDGRARSDCTCVQPDLDMHSRLLYHYFFIESQFIAILPIETCLCNSPQF